MILRESDDQQMKRQKSDRDQQKELQRYNARARKWLLSNDDVNISDISKSHPALDATKKYRDTLTSRIIPGSRVLEIGCGTGENTQPLIDLKCELYMLDISELSLEICRLKWLDKATYVNATMESLPFDENFFDAIVSAGSLSYGDPSTVDCEILRVLKHRGLVVFVDSLNHNPIYIINRFLHYLRGQRSFSTIKRIPRMNRIRKYQKWCEEFEVLYFGTFLWLSSSIRPFVGRSNARRIYYFLENSFGATRFAFKFIMVGTKR
jgi:ubiquinone/menaquinone biosynthesis C-methylase UbiE